MNTTSVTPEELNDFVAALSARHNSGLHAEYPTTPCNWEVVICERGSKYARLITTNEDHEKPQAGGYTRRSAMGFVNLSNGDILKADGWARPAKGPRGNIRVGDVSNLWNGAFTSYGGGLFAAYLR